MKKNNLHAGKVIIEEPKLVQDPVGQILGIVEKLEPEEQNNVIRKVVHCMTVKKVENHKSAVANADRHGRVANDFFTINPEVALKELEEKSRNLNASNR